jgi:hypothetical protein
MKPAIQKWQPYLSGKPKRIVSVTFEGGGTVDVEDESELRAYLKCLDDWRTGTAMGAGGAHTPRLPDVLSALRRVKASDAASKFRKHPNAEPGKVQAFIDKWIKRHEGRTHGAIKAAAAEFDCPESVIRRRMTKA